MNQRMIMGKLVANHSSIDDPMSEICSELKAHTLKKDIDVFH